MTIGHLTPLTELERDALGEVSNIAMARAANSLRQMVEHEVLLSVPAVEYYCPRIRQPSSWPSRITRTSWRCAKTSAELAGRALLIFPEANSLELVRAVVGRQLPLEDIVDLEDEALAETGNILLNSWVATIANLLKRGLRMSLPVVVRGDSRHMFENRRDPGTPGSVSPHQVRNQQEGDSGLCCPADGHPLDGRVAAAHRRFRLERHPEPPGSGSSRISDLSVLPPEVPRTRRAQSTADGTSMEPIPRKPRMRAIRALPGQDYRPSGATGEITIQSDDFALIAEFVALDGFRMARRTGKPDVLTSCR